MTEINNRLDILARIDELREEHYTEADESGFLRCERCGAKISETYNEEVIEHEAQHFEEVQ